MRYEYLVVHYPSAQLGTNKIVSSGYRSREIAERVAAGLAESGHAPGGVSVEELEVDAPCRGD